MEDDLCCERQICPMESDLCSERRFGPWRRICLATDKDKHGALGQIRLLSIHDALKICIS